MFFLFVWYSGALVTAWQIPDWIAQLYPTLAVKSKPSGWFLAAVAVLGLLLGVKFLTDGVNVALSTYAFMTDRESLRRKLRLRSRGMLSCFADDAERYRRIVLVAHSLGTAVAADALAEHEVDSFSVPPLDLITAGSPLEFLSFCRPEIQTSVECCLARSAPGRTFTPPKMHSAAGCRSRIFLSRSFTPDRSRLGFLGSTHSSAVRTVHISTMQRS